MVFVAAIFNLLVTVRVSGRFTERTWVANREHIDTKPILEAKTEFLIIEVETLGKGRDHIEQSPAWGIAEDRARGFRRAEGAFKRRESKVD